MKTKLSNKTIEQDRNHYGGNKFLTPEQKLLSRASSQWGQIEPFANPPCLIASSFSSLSGSRSRASKGEACVGTPEQLLSNRPPPKREGGLKKM